MNIYCNQKRSHVGRISSAKDLPDVQFGFDVEGLATTMPALAPGALDPVDPILFSTPCSATGLSLAIKLAREPVPRLDSLEGSVGRARHDERHRTVAAARFENDRGRIIAKEVFFIGSRSLEARRGQESRR